MALYTVMFTTRVDIEADDEMEALTKAKETPFSEQDVMSMQVLRATGVQQ